jgi:putative nucleotidyltransferase with HDIG domain
MNQTNATPDLPDEMFDDEQPFELRESHFFTVDQKFLLSGSARSFDLYTKRGEQFLLYRSSDLPFTPQDAETLGQSGTKVLYILNSEREKYLHYIEKNMLTTLVDNTIPMESRAATLYDMSTSVIGDLLANPDSKRHVTRSRELVDGIASFVGHAPGALQSLFQQDRMDAYVVTHCINTCVFGIGLAAAVGVKDPNDIRLLGLGCLLHDIGKQVIPERIVNKPGKLSPQEWMIMKRHPELGVQLCRKSGGIEELALHPILQHHERIDGSGYPRALKGDQIHLFGKITAAADIFDALTSDRPYSPANETFPALKLMKEQLEGKLDPEIFRHLILMLKAG